MSKKKNKARKKSQKRSAGRRASAPLKTAEAEVQRYLDWRGRAS